MKIGVSFYYPVVKVQFGLQEVILADALAAVKAIFQTRQRVSVTSIGSLSDFTLYKKGLRDCFGLIRVRVLTNAADTAVAFSVCWRCGHRFVGFQALVWPGILSVETSLNSGHAPGWDIL